MNNLAVAPLDTLAGAWDEVAGLVLPDLHDLVEMLRTRVPSVPVPEALYEVFLDDGSVVGTFELAWPALKRGIVLDENLVAKFPGWTVVVYAGQQDVLADEMGEAA